MSVSPYFSICVATRNRTETLYHCLRTLLHQDFEDYEILVSDNCDDEQSAKTRQIVQELNSSKLSYFKPDTILSMSDNYEFVLSKAKGKFILCMGDDDGLIINSLQYVYNFIKKYGAKIVKCPVAWYHWLNSAGYPGSLMIFPFPRPVINIDSRSILEKVAAFELGYFNLPMIYYSFVSRELIDNAIAEKGSFFQNCASIDMYSGFILAHKTKQFYVSDKPFVVAGVSSKSNGAAWVTNSSNIVTQEFEKQQGLKDAYKKYEIPLLPQYETTIFVLLELKKFVANYNLTNEDLKINTEKILLNFLSQQSVVNNIDKIRFKEYFQAYDIYKKDMKSIEENFIGKQVYFPFLSNSDIQLFHGEVIDPNLFGVKNVYDASVIFRKLVDGCKTLKPVSITIKGQSEPEKPILAKRVYGRVKRSLNVLLQGK